MSKEIHLVAIYDTETKRFRIEDDAISLNLVLFPEGKVWDGAIEMWDNSEEANELARSAYKALDSVFNKISEVEL